MRVVSEENRKSTLYLFPIHLLDLNSTEHAQMPVSLGT